MSSWFFEGIHLSTETVSSILELGPFGKAYKNIHLCKATGFPLQ